jgi:transposase
MKQRIWLHWRVRKTLRSKLGGKTPARIAKRARILLQLHEGKSITEVAEIVGCGTATVKRVRRHYREQGWERSIYDAPIPGRPRKLSAQGERALIALACTDPPRGEARWTIRLLVKHCGEDIGFGVVQRILKEDGLKPWREKNVVCTDDNATIQRTPVRLGRPVREAV